MSILSYILWNGSPEIIKFGSFALRWYGLFFMLGFLISQQILYYMYRKEGKPEKDVDTLTIYMIIATIIGARLGHVLFYQPEMIWQSPWEVILPFDLSPFRFTGYQGLASHGATIGILAALWWYSRKKKPGQSFLQVLDRIVILVALTGALIRTGNYFNSEIIGKPTDKPWGVVFANTLTDALTSEQVDSGHLIESIVYVENDSIASPGFGKVPMTMYIFFKPKATREQVESLVSHNVQSKVSRQLRDYFYEPPSLRPLEYYVAKPDDASGLVAKVRITGVARHPAQLYEAISCVFLFAFLFWLWARDKENVVPGRLFAIFLIWCFGMRILIEFLKKNQVSFEDKLPLNMGQILSIPLVLAGIIILVLTFRKKKE